MKRPWNRTNCNVYSLLTFRNKRDFNMNICTYVSVVNMNPRTYAISIDYKTLTFQNLKHADCKIVLQSLSKKNINLVRTLGKKSGLSFDKSNYLIKKKLVDNWKNYTVLKDTSFLIELTNQQKVCEMTDHCLFIFKVKSYKNISDDFLTFSNLIEKKIIL